MNQELLSSELNLTFSAKVRLEMKVGRFIVKTISRSEELLEAFALRYEVFQIETVGSGAGYGLDSDQFDAKADHLAILDAESGTMIATCRLNSSLFTRNFYSEQEFNCHELVARPETKLEIGRVCVHRDYRKSTIILLLWRAIAEYMQKTGTEILFGCGSVQTQDPREAFLLFQYLKREGKLRSDVGVSPTDDFRFREFEHLLLSNPGHQLTLTEEVMASALLPPLCRSYFDIGCYAAGAPAIDRDFKCIDFLTVLESKTLDPKVRRRMFGN